MSWTAYRNDSDRASSSPTGSHPSSDNGPSSQSSSFLDALDFEHQQSSLQEPILQYPSRPISLGTDGTSSSDLDITVAEPRFTPIRTLTALDPDDPLTDLPAFPYYLNKLNKTGPSVSYAENSVTHLKTQYTKYNTI